MFHTTIILDQQMLREMQSHATSTYPEECCGLLIGKFEGNLSRKLVSRTKRMENVFEKPERYHRYTIDPLKYMDAENEATSSGEDVIGIYHSHPNAPAKPSLFDISYAWPSLSYIVVEVRDSVPVETKSWILRDDRTEFIQENMEIQSG
ncbi:MAG TPA: M67 family metallopeptidase [Nitrososphaerales archaeon]|nr:M67 family metallopeptidase [Nitrososphaerales archaeon]